MGEKIVVGPVNKGLRTDRTPFVIDNDSFPFLVNAYQWRGRVKRKRGTRLLGRLNRIIDATGINTFNLLDGLETNASLVPGSISIIGALGTTWTDPDSDGVLVASVPGFFGTVNYSTGAFTGPGLPLIGGTFNYYPDLPVMGLEDLALQYTDFPGNIAFDTTYAYNIKTNYPFDIYDVSYYKNPAVDATNLPGYVPKTIWNTTTWNGEDYQQFWTTNYAGAFWATNGINVPFDHTHVGMQYKFITGITIITSGNGTSIPAVADLTIVAHGLVQGDFLFINEVQNTITPPTGITGINFQTGYVTSADPQAANLVRVTFPFAILGGTYTGGGIAQYLTNRSDTTKDCIRWYDGDPTNGVSPYNTIDTDKGWVNFCPPLSQDNYSIANLPEAKYYLVGARMIVPFKDRLLFIGPVVQTSTGIPIYLQDTIIYSQNGTPFYTSSYTNLPNAAIDNPTHPETIFHPILVPIDQTATSPAFFEDQTGFGGFLSAGLSQPMISTQSNEDVLIIGLSTIQTQLVSTGDDITPFNLFLINSELGTVSTFSATSMDRGVISRGSRGYIVTSQTQCQRIDLDIPDQVFQIKLNNNGNERFTSQRDFIKEWIYFTYNSNEVDEDYIFPNQTLMYNYRDDSYGIFNECYTTYGAFRKASGQTWQTLPVSLTWQSWNSPWNSGDSTLLNPEVIAGNQQGFVLFREGEQTGESNSLYIQNISSSIVTSPDHCLNNTDYIVISGALGTISSQVNGKIFSVSNSTKDTFILNPTIGSGTYFGGGLIQRMYVPFIQTRQFPVSWGMARKTRLGPQQYLISTTDNGQITLDIYLSQNDSSPYNFGTIVPATSPTLPSNNSLIYSSILYTCPESTNLGLTPSNTNLQMVTAINQEQIWHRMNTSLLGDTVQLGFTMSDEQMRRFSPSISTFIITGATATNPVVVTADNSLSAGTMVQISGVLGMTQLNNVINQPNPVYRVTSSSSTTVTLGIDGSTFSPYDSGGTITVVEMPNQFSEIEIHGFILDVNPSMLLA